MVLLFIGGYLITMLGTTLLLLYKAISQKEDGVLIIAKDSLYYKFRLIAYCILMMPFEGSKFLSAARAKMDHPISLCASYWSNVAAFSVLLPISVTIATCSFLFKMCLGGVVTVGRFGYKSILSLTSSKTLIAEHGDKPHKENTLYNVLLDLHWDIQKGSTTTTENLRYLYETLKKYSQKKLTKRKVIETLYSSFQIEHPVIEEIDDNVFIPVTGLCFQMDSLTKILLIIMEEPFWQMREKIFAMDLRLSQGTIDECVEDLTERQNRDHDDDCHCTCGEHYYEPESILLEEDDVDEHLSCYPEYEDIQKEMIKISLPYLTHYFVRAVENEWAMWNDLFKASKEAKQRRIKKWKEEDKQKRKENKDFAKRQKEIDNTFAARLKAEHDAERERLRLEEERRAKRELFWKTVKGKICPVIKVGKK